MNESIFKAYDVRGVYPHELNEVDSYHIGVGFACSANLAGETVVVGRDMRTSSQTIMEALVKGLVACGVAVIDVGLVTSPMLYYSVNKMKLKAGVMVTASHNSKQYNGFKFVLEGAQPLEEGTGLASLKAAALVSEDSMHSRTAQIRMMDVSDMYTEFMCLNVPVTSDRRVIIDTGNGAAGPIIKKVLDMQGVNYQPVFFRPDGEFPNHDANPLIPSNLDHLRCLVARQIGDIGAAFDGDGDRVCFIDEDGQVVPGDITTLIFALDELGVFENGDNQDLVSRKIVVKETKKTFLYDLRSSKIVPEMIEKFGGTAIMTRVGHAFIKKAMVEHDAVLGGELSYHYYWREFFNCESGVFALLKMLSILERTGVTLASIVKQLKKYNNSGEVNFEVNDPERTLATVRKRYADWTLDDLDGLTATYKDRRFNLRMSNTEPLLRLNVETNSTEDTQELVQEIIKLCQRSSK